MDSDARETESALPAEELGSLRVMECVAWLREWGFAAGPPVGKRPQPRQPRHDSRFEDELVLDIVDGHYRRPDPEARLLNAARVHEGRQALIDQGAYTVAEIARHRHQPPNSVYKQISRACGRAELFTVKFNGDKHIPAVLLDDALEARPHWRPVISALTGAGMSGWGIWHWLTEPNAGLSGETASSIIESNPDRVYAAARRRAAQIAA